MRADPSLESHDMTHQVAHPSIAVSLHFADVLCRSGTWIAVPNILMLVRLGFERAGLRPV